MLTKELITNKTQEFLKYASTIKGIHDLEDVYVDWVEKYSNMTMGEFKFVWANINNEIANSFGTKIALNLTPEEFRELYNLMGQGPASEVEVEPIEEEALPISETPPATAPEPSMKEDTPTLNAGGPFTPGTVSSEPTKEKEESTPAKEEGGEKTLFESLEYNL